MTFIVRIDPDGTVTEFPPDVRDLLLTARDGLGEATSTFTCRPITDGPPDLFPNFAAYIVGVCHDLAYYAPDPVCNPKAWALYGRSPIAGPAYFAHDSDLTGRQPLDDVFIERLRGDFVIPGVMNVAHMRSLAADAGLRWPE